MALTRSEGVAALTFSGPAEALSGVRLFPPVEKASHVMVAGANYAMHLAADFGLKSHYQPIAFPKTFGALIGAQDALRYPLLTKELDDEADLVQFRPEGVSITAGNASRISDGAAVLMLMSADAVKRLRVKSRARIRAMTTVSSDPTLMLTGPIAATRKVLAKAALTLDDINLFEVNEAFASVPLVWIKETGVSHERLNLNAGAIALGYPLGASGARIMTSVLHELERRGASYGLQATCCAGGMATATVIERLS